MLARNENVPNQATFAPQSRNISKAPRQPHLSSGEVAWHMEYSVTPYNGRSHLLPGIAFEGNLSGHLFPMVVRSRPREVSLK